MGNKLIIYAPNEEYLCFQRFNAFLYRYKDMFEEIIPIIVPKAIDIISSATSFISISNKYLDDHNANYPIREEFNCKEIRDKYSSDFRNMAFKYVMKNYDISNYEFWEWKSDKIIDFKTGNNIQKEFNANTLGKGFERDFKYICEWLNAGNTLKPTKEKFEATKNKYGHLFNEKTYVIVTRNFTYKQPNTNTHEIIKNFKGLITYLTENGIRIINIGFPCSHVDVNNENYYEISDSMDQGQLMSMFYMANACIFVMINAGFGVHGMTNCDMFGITRDWAEGTGFSMVKSRMTNKSIYTNDIRDYIGYEFFGDKAGSDKFNEILKLLNEHKKVSKNLFIDKREVVYIDEILS